MVMIDVGNPKMAREMLCAIQSQIDFKQIPSGNYHATQISKMISQLDEHRPLGSDGKHGDLHTSTCGCDPETVEEFLNKKIFQQKTLRRTPNNGWETADGDYSLFDSGYYD